MIAFATCDTNEALKFIQRFYKIEKEDIPELLELINLDKVRVLDPDFHSPCQIVEGNNYKESDRELIMKACEQLKKFDTV